MQTVSFPAVGTYRREMQMSPSFSGCREEQGVGTKALSVLDMVPHAGAPHILLNLQCKPELASTSTRV